MFYGIIVLKAFYTVTLQTMHSCLLYVPISHMQFSNKLNLLSKS
jgi:hypothetical protein